MSNELERHFRKLQESMNSFKQTLKNSSVDSKFKHKKNMRNLLNEQENRSKEELAKELEVMRSLTKWDDRKPVHLYHFMRKPPVFDYGVKVDRSKMTVLTTDPKSDDPMRQPQGYSRREFQKSDYPRSFWYLSLDQKESMVDGPLYTVKMDASKIYDLGDDPLKLMHEATVYAGRPGDFREGLDYTYIFHRLHNGRPKNDYNEEIEGLGYKGCRYPFRSNNTPPLGIVVLFDDIQAIRINDLKEYWWEERVTKDREEYMKKMAEKRAAQLKKQGGTTNV